MAVSSNFAVGFDGFLLVPTPLSLLCNSKWQNVPRQLSFVFVFFFKGYDKGKDDILFEWVPTTTGPRNGTTQKTLKIGFCPPFRPVRVHFPQRGPFRSNPD